MFFISHSSSWAIQVALPCFDDCEPASCFPITPSCISNNFFFVAQELREMVIRGAYEHPGAVAVEDELGRIVLLHKLPINVGYS